MSTVVTRTVKSSELSRNSAEVFRAADSAPVEITRRDGETLVLMRKGELDHHVRVLELVADVVAAALGPDDQPFVDRLQDRFPWMRFLTAEEREAFAGEIVDGARACAALGNFTPFLMDIHEWRATAEAKAAGYSAATDLDRPRHRR